MYILNSYNGGVANFIDYFKEKYYRLQKEKVITISAYMLIKKVTGQKIEAFEKFMDIEDETENQSYDEIQSQVLDGIVVKEAEDEYI